jgi:predicted Zn-dependent peptidase
MESIIHRTLDCGIELGVMELPDRHAVAMELRFLSGTCDEPEALLGVGRMIQETIDLGTEHFDGRGLSDAFDEIGASHGGWVGREASSYHCMVLPEFVDRAVELHAEFLRRPTFPADKVEVAKTLTRQEIHALDDDPQGLADKYIGRQAYGSILGRHALGELETVDRISRESMVEHYQRHFGNGRLMVSVAGAVQADAMAVILEKYFSGFGDATHSGRKGYKVSFGARRAHYMKDSEQEQIAIAFPGVAKTATEYPAQRAMLAVLSGGMSSRLFTEVREKQGLVYWVAAWGEQPRGDGMIFLGASTKPERCDQTYATLLREVDRVGEDLTEEELDRAVAGIVAKVETRGDITRSRCSEIADDLFHYGRYVGPEEKTAKIKAVTVESIQDYLRSHPRDALSVVTLGPRVLEGAEVVEGDELASTGRESGGAS